MQKENELMQWYVIQILSGKEHKVKDTLDFMIKSENMDEKINQVLVPIEQVSEVKAGVKKITNRKFFPGYILVEMELDDEVWHFIKETQGVIGFVGSDRPIPLLQHEIDSILMQMNDQKEKIKPKVLFEKDETVKINDGPFVNFNGVVDEIDPDRGKLKVTVSIFGRATPVELEYWQVEKA